MPYLPFLDLPERSRGCTYVPTRVNGSWRRVRSLHNGDGYPRGLVWVRALYILLSFTSTSPFLQGFSFLPAESSSVFIHFLFHHLLFFTQAVGVIILLSSALHRSSSTAFSSFRSKSILDSEQTWETSFGTSTPVLLLSPRVFVSLSLRDHRLVWITNPIVCALADICRYLLGRLLGPNLAQIFLGFRWRDIARPRRVPVSSPFMRTLTFRVFPPDRIDH